MPLQVTVVQEPEKRKPVSKRVGKSAVSLALNNKAPSRESISWATPGEYTSTPPPTNSTSQVLSQDSEIGAPKTGFCKFLGHPNFQGRPQYTQITAITMNLLIEIRHNIH